MYFVFALIFWNFVTRCTYTTIRTLSFINQNKQYKIPICPLNHNFRQTR